MKEHSWVAYLSDGRSISNKDLFLPNDELPIKKLVRLIKRDNVDIVSMTLFVNGVRYNSPSNSGKAAFISATQIEKFWVCYRDRYFPIQKRALSFVGLSWKMGEYRTILWVSLGNDNPISWFEITGIETGLERLINEFYEEDK